MPYPFELPELGYAHDALEPHIDARTMQIHHGKHHQGYTTKFNAALEGHPETHQTGGILGPGDVAITSITRNFEGRMGPGGEIYLASPATVAASAVAGCIANPLQYR